MDMGILLLLPALLFLLSFCSCASYLQDSEREALLQLKSILENPSPLANWGTQTDFCNLPSTSSLTLVCECGFVTHLQITGSNTASASSNTASTSNLTTNGRLSSSFSSESLFIHLSNFSRLKVLQLSSLGLWGPLPSKLGRLSTLEALNMSSNFFWGVLPNRLKSLQSLQSLILDNNVLNGSLPQSWSSLPLLTTLSLSANKITGQIPAAVFSQLPGLKTLVLDSNFLSGDVPPSLSNASALQALSIAGNQLSGNLPDLRGLVNLLALNLENNHIGPEFPMLPLQLLYLALGKNKLQGPIPSSITNLRQLQQLDLSSNLISGVPSAAFLSLPSVKYFNVARNQLSGSLPANLTMSRNIKMLDVSYNLLTGHLPMVLVTLAATTGASAIRFQWNCLSTTLQPQNPFDYCQNAALASSLDPHLLSPHGTGSQSRVGILAGITAGVLAMALSSLVGLFILIHRRRSGRIIAGQPLKPMGGGGPCMNNKAVSVSSELLANARYITRTLKLGAFGFPQFRTFSMDELYKATDYFHESSLIGEGNRGEVYKGQLDDGSLVVIKRLKKEHFTSTKNVKARLERLAKFRHQHLVSLLGYNFVCEDDQGGAQVCLIYEYVSNRTLRSRLAGRGQDGFGWLQRLHVIIGAAKGVHFLHSGLVPGIFNNDIKITNVLLDQNLVPKISDFGLASRLDATEDADGRLQLMSGFSPSEKERKKLLGKDDVYNFGLILLEVLVGKPWTLQQDKTGGSKVLETYMGEHGSRLEVIDPKILGSCNMESLETVMEIAAKCLSPNAMMRPSMEDVLWNLQYAMQVQDASNGGSQDDIGDGVFSSDFKSEVKLGRKMSGSVSKLSGEDVGKPSSPNADFFR